MADLLDDADNDSGTPDDVTGGGVFQQPMNNFDHSLRQDVENPQVVRAQEQVPENLPGTPAPEPVRVLAFAQDAQGRVTCAHVVNGNLTEPFRQPTAEEAALAPKARWKAMPQQPVVQPQRAMVQQPAAVGMFPLGQGTVLGQSVGPQPLPVPQQPQSSGIGKLLVGAAVVGGLAWAGWSAWNWAKDQGLLDEDDPDAPEGETEDDATARELDEADDVDDEMEA
jgi:hypothetical protein